MNKQMRFFARDDDVFDLTSNLVKFSRMMIELKVPVIYGIIPGKIEKKLSDFLSKLKKDNDSLVHLAQHGWMHANYGKTRKYEFGMSRDYETQKKDILQGLGIMQKLFGFKKRIFIPPYNHLNKATVRALEGLNFEFISTDLPAARLGKIRNLPAIINFETFTDNGVKKKTLRELLLDFAILSRKTNSFGIYFHHRTLEKRDFETIRKFMEILKGKKVKFVL
ncbi:MAG: DUF2334 domain-containing protein [archaeon]